VDKFEWKDIVDLIEKIFIFYFILMMLYYFL